MQINHTNMSALLPATTSTNTGYEGSKVISEDATFTEELNKATDKLNDATSKVKTMTAEELAQRNQEIREASTELEAILLKMMYDAMMKTVPKDELFGDDNAMDIWRDMYNEKMTQAAAQAGGIGLADFIYDQLTRKNH